MGDRAGYRFKGVENQKSAYLRKQWAITEEEERFEKVTEEIASNLLDGEDIGSGLSALRGDLKSVVGRGLHALVEAEGRLPMDEISSDVPVDIRRVIEFDVSDPYEWEIRYIPVDFDKGLQNSESEVIAEIHFKEGESLQNGMQFDWIGHKNR